MNLKDVIEGETQADFEKRVEAFFAYEFRPGETWTLFDDFLIVAHPERQPIMISQGGLIKKLEPFHPGQASSEEKS